MNIKGTELLKILENRRQKLSWHQLFKRRKIESRIERLKELGLNDYYSEFNDIWTKCETFDPDLQVHNRKKSKEIIDANEPIGRCLNCEFGTIFETDPLERIGQCNRCFEEFKLEG